MIKRRQFIAGLAGAAAWPVVARAQQPTMPVVGWLDRQSPETEREVLSAFRMGLAETGYVEGRNVIVEYHWAENDSDRLSALAADLVRRRVAVIVAPDTSSALAAKAATQSIPIVFRTGTDPVALGLVASFNRPSGNLTGVTSVGAEIIPKRLAPPALHPPLLHPLRHPLRPHPRDTRRGEERGSTQADRRRKGRAVAPSRAEASYGFRSALDCHVREPCGSTIDLLAATG